MRCNEALQRVVAIHEVHAGAVLVGEDLELDVLFGMYFSSRSARTNDTRDTTFHSFDQSN